MGAIILPLFRQQGTPSWRTLWDEDGLVYTEQAVNLGPLHVVLRGYNGYLQLPPRLIALPTPYFSLRYLALYCSLTSVLVAAMLAWGVYHWSRGWIRSRSVRVALASLVVLMPALGLDSTATTTNLIWPFLAVLPWALISMEEAPFDVVTRSTVAALGAASSLLAFFFFPLALGWLVYRRSRAAVAVTAAFVAGAILQAVVALTTKTNPNLLDAHRSLADTVNIAEGEGGHVFGMFLLGTRWESDLGSISGIVAVLLPTVVVVVLLVVLGVGASRRDQVVAAAFTVTAIAIFAGTAWERGPGIYGLSVADIAANPRYSVPSVMLLASAMALLLSSEGRLVRPTSRKVGRWLFVVLTIVLIAAGFSMKTIRGVDPPWIGRVKHVVATDCAGSSGTQPATVPNGIAYTSHSFPDGIFAMTVPCRNLR